MKFAVTQVIWPKVEIMVYHFILKKWLSSDRSVRLAVKYCGIFGQCYRFLDLVACALTV